MKKQIAFLVAAMALAAPAHAQDGRVDPERVMTLLKDAGYPAEFFNDDADYRQILSKSGDYNFLVEMYDCVEGKACQTIEFYSNFPMETPPTKEKLDAYPGPREGARLSLDRRGEARVQQELDISGEGGLTDQRFIDGLKSWEAVMTGVAAYLHDQPIPAAAGAGAAPAPAPAAEAADAT